MWSDIRLPRLFSVLFLFFLPFAIGTSAFGNSLPPTARIDMDPQRPNNLVYEGETIFFDGSASWDADGGSIVLYEWYINGVYHAGGSTMSYQFTLGSTNQTVKLRVKDDEGSWDDETITLTVTTRPKRYYYLKDHLGSVRVTFNENGDVVHYDDYYPFGLQMPGRSMEVDGPKERFTGHEKDGETGLYYAGARFLDPAVGRWMSVDPYDFAYPEWSPYSYALNSPISYYDPLGLYPICGDNCDETYKEGNVVENEYGRWQYEGNNQWRDLNTGELVSGRDLLNAFNTILSEQETSGVTVAALAPAIPWALGEPTLLGEILLGAAATGFLSWQILTAPSPEVVVGQPVLQAKGSTKHSPHASQRAKEAAQKKLQEAQAELERLRRTPNKTKELKRAIKKLENKVKQLRQKAQERGETHSRTPKGNR